MRGQVADIDGDLALDLIVTRFANLEVGPTFVLLNESVCTP